MRLSAPVRQPLPGRPSRCPQLKAKITEVSSWLAENGGSEDQKKCVRDTYRLERYSAAVEGSDPDDHPRIQTSRIESGLAAGTEVWSDYGGTVHKDLRARFWLEGGDSDLFEVQLGSAAPYDVDGDGTNDTSRFERRLHIVRPLPSGTYSFQVHEQGALYTLCDGWVYRYPVTVTVNAPAGVTAESFFDPAASGTAATGATTLGVDQLGERPGRSHAQLGHHRPRAGIHRPGRLGSAAAQGRRRHQDRRHVDVDCVAAAVGRRGQADGPAVSVDRHDVRRGNSPVRGASRCTANSASSILCSAT